MSIASAVFALWKVPDLLPSFILKGGEVSRFIIGGADLMFPGINVPGEGLPSFLPGEPWAVKVPGNRAPIAVSLLWPLFLFLSLSLLPVPFNLASSSMMSIWISTLLSKGKFYFMQVGSTTISSTEALKAGLRGKALRITHYYRDFLW